jgi:hypothetical protein
MSGFHILALRPEDIIPRLGKGEFHWKRGRSAYELSYRWMEAQGFPESVRSVLALAPNWSEARILDAFFERETQLRSRGRPSQTDLLLLVRMSAGNGVIAVEGKVDEPFGLPVRDWLSNGTEPEGAGRKARLESLCTTLGLVPDASKTLFYQLLHRTAAAIYEAKDYEFSHAIMLVHSFSPNNACFAEFAQFADAMGLPVKTPNSISSAKNCDGVELRLAWVSDQNSAQMIKG